MTKQMLDRPLSHEQLYQLRDDIRRVQEPYIQLLVDLYAVSPPKITIADGIIETTYSPDVEKQAAQIRSEMTKAVEMVTRYKPELVPLVSTNSCNRHVDCEMAVKVWLEKHPGQVSTDIPFSFHCHDDECEDCFGC
jgi:hypothetical protein